MSHRSRGKIGEIRGEGGPLFRGPFWALAPFLVYGPALARRASLSTPAWLRTASHVSRNLSGLALVSAAAALLAHPAAVLMSVLIRVLLSIERKTFLKLVDNNS